MQHKGKYLGLLSISVGLAMYPDSATNSDELLRLADLALYDAKHSGRNRVQISRQKDVFYLIFKVSGIFLLKRTNG